MENEQARSSDDAARFLQLLAMFQVAALQQMGKLVNPATNEVERDLQQAKASIDMLETIKVKTTGNLSAAEAEFLDKILFELHMDYVDEVKRSKGEGERGQKRAAENGEAGEEREGSSGQGDEEKAAGGDDSMGDPGAGGREPPDERGG